jgi:hypothetical protein
MRITGYNKLVKPVNSIAAATAKVIPAYRRQPSAKIC